MTQIQLEHTRKLTFIPEKKSSGLLVPTAGDGSESGMAVGKEMPAANHEFGSKPLPHIQFKKYASGLWSVFSTIVRYTFKCIYSIYLLYAYIHTPCDGDVLIAAFVAHCRKPFHSSQEICGRIDKTLDFRLPKRGQRKTPAPPAAAAPTRLKFVAHDDSQSPTFASLGDYDSEQLDDEEGNEDEEEQDPADTIVLVDGQNTTTEDTLPTLTRGAWPWLAAIYVNNLTSLDFQCGGTLVSSRVIISSAHCFQMFNQRYTANEVLVFLGRHNLKNWNEEGSLAAPVDGIYIHSDYNKQLSNYDGDIAIVLLKDEVR